jgi:acyl-CoA dehydrogenase
MDATRVLTATAIDLAQKPAVISGITKLHLTERGRQVVIDGMDVVGGKGICMGPSNFIGAAYMQLPVMITVEGANILTRSLIVFGQGAIRCHPYVLKEIEATREADHEKASIAFDDALFSHLRFTLSISRAVRHGHHRAQLRSRPGERRARSAPLLPAAPHAFFRGIRAACRSGDGALGGTLKRRRSAPPAWATSCR